MLSLRPLQWKRVGQRSGAGGSVYSLDILFARPLLAFKNWRHGVRVQTLSKPGWTARTLRPSGYGVFAHQRDQSLCLRTPHLDLHLLEKGLEGPTYGISIEERLSGRPS